MRTPRQPVEWTRDKTEFRGDEGQFHQTFYTKCGKRALDIFLSASGLACLAPLFVVVACGIKLTSRGPILFRQTRVGKDNHKFQILKFRSMVTNAERNGARITVSGDRRVTRVGRLLRQCKVDELPQLWNVLRGQMSLVGPRPELPLYVAGYSQQERVVLSARPGITDPASLSYRNEEEILAGYDDPENVYRTRILPHKLAMNIAYLRRISLKNDLLIIVQTMAQLVDLGRITVQPQNLVLRGEDQDRVQGS